MEWNGGMEWNGMKRWNGCAAITLDMILEYIRVSVVGTVNRGGACNGMSSLRSLIPFIYTCLKHQIMNQLYSSALPRGTGLGD